MRKIFHSILLMLSFFPTFTFGYNGLVYLDPPNQNALVNFNKEVAVVLFNRADGVDLLQGTESVNDANLYSYFALGYESPGGILIPPSSDNYLVNYSISLNCVSANPQDTVNTATLNASIAYLQGKFGAITKVGTQSATVKVGEVLNLSNQYLISGLDPSQPTFVYLILSPSYSDFTLNFALTSFSACGTACENNAPIILGIESTS